VGAASRCCLVGLGAMAGRLRRRGGQAGHIALESEPAGNGAVERKPPTPPSLVEIIIEFMREAGRFVACFVVPSAAFLSIRVAVCRNSSAPLVSQSQPRFPAFQPDRVTSVRSHQEQTCAHWRKRRERPLPDPCTAQQRRGTFRLWSGMAERFAGCFADKNATRKWFWGPVNGNQALPTQFTRT
jgi:hypothetical protein